jgi:hypothetical protein
VRVVATRRLIEAFTEWGLHEWNGRIQRPRLELNAPEAVLAGINTALWYRAPLIARVLNAGPHEHCLRVEISFEEAGILHIADGRRLATWTDAIVADRTSDGEFVRARAAKDDIAIGPLVCTAQFADESIRPPIVIFDGWHRAATWVAHGRRGLSYAIVADLILTDKVPQLLGDLQP